MVHDDRDARVHAKSIDPVHPTTHDQYVPRDVAGRVGSDIVLSLLPDDDGASFTDITPYQGEREILFSYETRPSIPLWLYPFVRYLPVVSYAFAHKNLPDRWLYASVTVWNSESDEHYCHSMYV